MYFYWVTVYRGVGGFHKGQNVCSTYFREELRHSETHIFLELLLLFDFHPPSPLKNVCQSH